MPSYPTTLPLPETADYKFTSSFGNEAVVFEHGNTRQRSRGNTTQYYFTLSFILTTVQLAAWQIWATRYGYDWHTIDFTGKPFLISSNLLPTTLRYVSDMSIDPISDRYFKATVTAETS